MKRGRFLAVLLCMAGALTGCGIVDGFSPEVSGISIDKKGGITEVVRENFDQSYYSEDELESEIAKEIEEYNTQAGDKAVKEKGLKIKNGVAQLKMTYASSEDYANFNRVDFFTGNIIGAVQAGYMFEGSFWPVSDGKIQEDSAVWGSEIISGTNYQVVAVKGPLLVEVPGKIVYVSSNVKVTDKSTGVVEETSKAYIIYE